jgi:hypothetical protein
MYQIPITKKVTFCRKVKFTTKNDYKKSVILKDIVYRYSVDSVWIVYG